MKLKKILSAGLCISVLAGALAGCGGGSSGAGGQVIIYSNADDEAVAAMSGALDAGGYQGRYLIETFGTSELGGKLMAEGAALEADLVTMSTFYLESAQAQNSMFLPLSFEVKTLSEFPDYCAPITAQEGAIILNTDVMKEYGLKTPAGIRDLTAPEYAGHLAVTDIQSSSTAWLLIQAIVSAYGEEGARGVLSGIYQNAGDHIESSGSAPLKLCRAGETAIGFGLRHQAAADKANGLPIDYVDPAEGNFSLTESAAVVDKGEKSNPLAMEMARCIIENARAELIKTYPNPLYEGETADPANQSAHPMTFGQPLTFELFRVHQQLSESAKP